jgi:hypothetical protein
LALLHLVLDIGEQISDAHFNPLCAVILRAIECLLRSGGAHAHRYGEQLLDSRNDSSRGLVSLLKSDQIGGFFID